MDTIRDFEVNDNTWSWKFQIVYIKNKVTVEEPFDKEWDLIITAKHFTNNNIILLYIPLPRPI